LQGFFINQAAFKDAIKEQHLNNCDLAWNKTRQKMNNDQVAGDYRQTTES
jgi:hypothetical protein